MPGLVNWGNTPAHSTGLLYLPAVRASEVISLASKHFLIALDTQHDRLPGGRGNVRAAQGALLESGKVMIENLTREQ